MNGICCRQWIRVLCAFVWFAAGPSAAVTSPQTAGEGKWSSFYDWSTQLNSDPNCGNQQELVHAALIPRGSFRGTVLLWRSEQRGVACQNVNTPITYIFDPAMPSSLIELPEALTSDIFCAGQSWDKYGQLVVAGGIPVQTEDCEFPVETYRFRPQVLSGALVWDGGIPTAVIDMESSPWKRVGDMAIERYYPTVLPLSRRSIDNAVVPDFAGGSSLVAGGPQCGGGEGNEFWELLEAQPAGATEFYDPVIPEDPTGLDPEFGNRPNSPNYEEGGSPNPGEYEPYDRPPPVADPLLDSYPRMHQLSPNGAILVCGDVQDGGGTPVNAPGSVWVMRPRYDAGPTPWQFWKGPIVQPPTGTGRECTVASVLSRPSERADALVKRELTGSELS